MKTQGFNPAELCIFFQKFIRTCCALSGKNHEYGIGLDRLNHPLRWRARRSHACPSCRSRRPGEPASGGMVRRAPELTPISRTPADAFPEQTCLDPLGRRCRIRGLSGLAAFLPTCWLPWPSRATARAGVTPPCPPAKRVVRPKKQLSPPNFSGNVGKVLTEGPLLITLSFPIPIKRP